MPTKRRSTAFSARRTIISTKKKKTGGLAGVTAGRSAIATVGQAGKGLNYRGYSIHDLAEHAGFEEVAYLLLNGTLPSRDELDAYRRKLQGLRGLPEALRAMLERLPATAQPMDVLRTGCSMLGCLEPEKPGPDFTDQRDIADRLVGALPSILLYWYRFGADGTRIDTETDDPSIAAQYLHLLHGRKPDPLHERALDVSLILYAEHEFNASTFTARTCASTLSEV